MWKKVNKSDYTLTLNIRGKEYKVTARKIRGGFKLIYSFMQQMDTIRALGRNDLGVLKAITDSLARKIRFEASPPPGVSLNEFTQLIQSCLSKVQYPMELTNPMEV